MDHSAGINRGTIIGGDAGSFRVQNVSGYSRGSGAGGIGVQLAVSTFTNAGTITGGFGAGEGANLFSGAVLTNTGLIMGGEASFTVIYNGGGDEHLSGNGGVGVEIHGASLTNHGTIIGGTASSSTNGAGPHTGAGVFIEGGTINNTGEITGGSGGFYLGDGIDLVGGTVVNTGRISGGVYTKDSIALGGAGVNISTGTLIASGTITGSASYFFDAPKTAYGAGVYINAGTVIASGTITGGYDYSTYTLRDAVAFGTLAGTLVIDPGAVFNGQVAATAGDGDALILAGAKQGTLAGFGTQFTGFDSLTVNAGAHWSLTGTAALAIGLPVQDNGVLTLGEAVTGSGTITIGDNATLNAQQAVAGPTVAFTGPGRLSIGDAKGFTSPITGFGTGDVVDLTHLKATSATFANNTLTLLNGTTTVGSLAFAGTFTSTNFSLTADGHGGTDLTFAASSAADFAPLLAITAQPEAASALAETHARLHANPADSHSIDHLAIGGHLPHSA
jgi:fibronectin-binding autotransporter adhesin